MKNLEYNLEIIGEKKNYTPHKEIIEPILKSDKKIFEITADNSYGKTFILNLLAYALDADKLDDDRILPSIKKEISRYDEVTSYNLDYSIGLNLPNNKQLSLTKEKGRNKLIQIDGEAPVGYNTLHKYFSIIYDVPTNPSERLNAVIKDLGIWNDNLQSKFVKISSHLNNVKKEFDSVRNEEKIARLKEESNEYNKKIKEKDNQIENKITLERELNTLINLNNLKTYLKNKLNNDLQVFKKTKAFKLLKKPQKIESKDETKIKNLNKELTTVSSSFREIIAALIKHINDDREIYELITENSSSFKHYENIKEKEITDLVSTENDIIIQDSFLKSIEYLKVEVLSFITKKRNDKSYIIHNSYKEFISLLEKLMVNEIDYLLNVDSKTLKNQLESIIREHKIINYDSIKNFFSSGLKPLKGNIAQYYRLNIQLKKENEKKLVNNTDSKYYKLDAELKEFKDKAKKATNNYNITAAICATDLKFDDLSKFDSLDKISNLEYSLETKISKTNLTENPSISKAEIDKEIKALRKLKEGLAIKKRMTDKIFEKEDAKNPSKYSPEQQTKIENFSTMVNRIIVNTTIFGELISNIEKGDLTKFKEHEDFRFIEIAGKIIAFSMDNKLLRADGKFLDLKFYDMIKQEFHCNDNIIVKKADVSTGLASANYLKQRIENAEGEYVIVLLDEIGNMAQNALNKVIESIKKLEQQNRLVLAVFTRPNSNGIKIIQY